MRRTNKKFRITFKIIIRNEDNFIFIFLRSKHLISPILFKIKKRYCLILGTNKRFWFNISGFNYFDNLRVVVDLW